MTSTTDGAVPVKRRRDRAARELEILDAAERIFGERGYQGTSMDDVAAEVGVSKPLIYQYYGSKDGLFLACLSRLRAQLLDAVSDAVLGAADPEQAMYAGFLAWFTFLDDHPRAWAVLVDEGMLAAGPAAQAADEVRAEFVALIATMVRLNLPAGRPADEEEIQIVAQTVSGATERLAVWRTRNGGTPSAEKVATTLQQLLWQGLDSLRR
ncbi:TetR/AcrR family transcriptional regulator [Kribbella sp. CA-293567]|uniref:TetR/AcrR family transcriptional regulator n=1 Tax=Kribbella sp. CA-293567 TaxID=3002436 RepID=UPI0022DD627E|nr:TetR/AcrR family transcriptional regulator [Kribbella sp. CA-293567]WBQ03722.1 TetR/AcrR family transcriptional regulator [Kribbella sp. CA-293567]